MTSKVAKPADGDDYTWEPLPGGAVLNVEQTREVLAGQTVTLELDLRTPDQRERDDVAALNLRVDNLVDAVEMLTRRVAELERALVTVKA